MTIIKYNREIWNIKKVGKTTSMTSNLKEKDREETQEKMQKERRGFLKKAVYAAPTLMVMGQLARPTQSKAWGERTPSDPQYVE